MLLHEGRGYRVIFSGRTINRKAEGVGLAFSPYAWKALCYYEAVSPSILTAEGLRGSVPGIVGPRGLIMKLVTMGRGLWTLPVHTER